jgi:hypothetical protein
MTENFPIDKNTNLKILENLLTHYKIDYKEKY